MTPAPPMLDREGSRPLTQTPPMLGSLTRVLRIPFAKTDDVYGHLVNHRCYRMLTLAANAARGRRIRGCWLRRDLGAGERKGGTPSPAGG